MENWNFLPDEIWFEIFEFFSIPEKIFYESVCKRWQKILRIELKRKKFLNLHSILYFDYSNGISGISRRDRKLESILKRCENLQFLKLAEIRNFRSVQNFTAKFEFTPKILNLIENFCFHLKILDLSHHFFADEKILESLANSLPPFLIEFRLENCRLDTLASEAVRISGLAPVDEIFSKIFKRLPNLEIFSLRSSCYGFLVVTEKSLENCPKNLKILDLSGNYAVNLWNVRFLKKLPELEEFFAERSGIFQNDLKEICDHFQFRALNLSYSKNLNDFSPISNLTNLRFLALDGNRENLVDSAFFLICQNCKELQNLSIENCQALTSNGLRSIADLKNLTILKLTSVTNFDDFALERFFCIFLHFFF